jgi:hypothetical protein
MKFNIAWYIMLKKKKMIKPKFYMQRFLGAILAGIIEHLSQGS